MLQFRFTGGLESFARCLRHFELVGMDCLEKYFPHRVAMQFGLDQDIPGRVPHCKEINPKDAWRNYDRPMTETMLRIAAVASSSTLEPAVTCKYLEWWKRSKLGLGEKPSTSSKPISISKKLSQSSSEMGSQFHRDQTGESDKEDGSTVKELKKRSHSHEADVSMADGVENLAKSLDLNVVGRSKRATLDAKMEDVIGKSGRAGEGKYGDKGKEGEYMSDCTVDKYFSDYETRIEKLERVVAKSEDLNVVGESKRTKLDAKMEDMIGKSERDKGGKYGDDGNEGEGVNNCTIDIYFSDFETRIEELERVVAKLKAAKLGYKSGDFGAKAGLS